MRGGVVFIALALIFVLSTSAQEPRKHDRQNWPKPIWTGPQLQQLLGEAKSIARQASWPELTDRPQNLFKQGSEKYPKSPKIPDSYFDGAQWELAPLK